MTVSATAVPFSPGQSSEVYAVCETGRRATNGSIRKSLCPWEVGRNGEHGTDRSVFGVSSDPAPQGRLALIVRACQLCIIWQARE